jgi:hypothetical protein
MRNRKTFLGRSHQILTDDVIKGLSSQPEIKQRAESLAEDANLLSQGEKEHARLKMHALNRVRTQLEDMDKGIRDGISYRRIRSVYNRNIFISVVRAMRIKRIEGFQPYDQFVEHRLLRSYSLLEAIAERHRVLTAREAELRKKWQTETAVHHQQAIKEFQSNAEQMLFLVLVPYYVIATVLHVWHHGEEILTIFQKGLIAWGVSLLCFSSFRLRKSLQGRKKKRDGSG